MIESLELDDRITKCEKILAADENSQIFAALADAYRRKGDIQRAQEVCARGLSIHPDYASARIVMAKILLELKKYDAAWQELKKAVDSAGRTRAVDLLESEILIHKGRRNEARAILEKLYISDPEDETIVRLMDSMSAKKKSRSSPDVVMPDFSLGGSKKEKLMLADVVSILRIMSRVRGVVAIDRQGVLIESRLEPSISEEEMVTLSKTVLEALADKDPSTVLGKVHDVLIETESSKFWVIIRDKFILVICAWEDVSLGTLKLKLDDLLSRVNGIAEEAEMGNSG
jgi:tetratricopeptide (TPR) repeat protein